MILQRASAARVGSVVPGDSAFPQRLGANMDKQDLIAKVTHAMIEVGGENMRGVSF